MEIDDLGLLLGRIVAIGGSAWAIVKGGRFIWTKAIKPMFDIFQSNYKNLKAIPALVEDMAQLKETVRKEFSPNGGSSIRDILDRLESNQVVMAAQQDIQLHTQKLAIIRMNNDGDVVSVSEPLCALLKRQKEELLGKNWINVICPDDRDEIQSGWMSAVEDHRNFSVHFNCCGDDNELIRVMMKANPLPGRAGLGFIGTITQV
jgi:PAS domain-containing protein